MKLDEIYKLLTKDNFKGDNVLKVCLTGDLYGKGIIKASLDTDYSATLIIESIGQISIDKLEINSKMLYGHKNQGIVYSVPLDKIKSIEIDSKLEHEKFHRPIYIVIK